jgi:hypothetical protein
MRACLALARSCSCAICENSYPFPALCVTLLRYFGVSWNLTQVCLLKLTPGVAEAACGQETTPFFLPVPLTVFRPKRA